MLFRTFGQDRLPTAGSAGGPYTQGIDLYTTMWYDPATINSSTRLMTPGAQWEDTDTGNCFMYVRATAALTTGLLVGSATPVTGTITAAGSTVNIVNTNIDTTSLGNLVGNYLWCLDAVGVFSAGVTPYKQSLRRILAHSTGTNASFTLSIKDTSSNNQQDPNSLKSVPTNGSACSVIAPWDVILATSLINPVGVALGKVDINNYTIVQTRGLAMCAMDGTIAAVAQRPASVSGTAGTLSGVSTTVAISLTTAGSSILSEIAFASGTVSLVPCFVNFTGT